LKKLKDKIANNIAARGYLIGLDGRPLFCRSDFKGLNVLLQSSGALIMKQVVIELHKKMYDLGYIYGHDWQQHAMVHDECPSLLSTSYGRYLDIRCIRSLPCIATILWVPVSYLMAMPM
jgi:hypothetical protein